MPNFERNLHQTVTYWEPTGSDVYGKKLFAAPVTRLCRWEDKSEVFRNARGEEETSKSKVFLATDIDFYGYLYLGTSVVTDPTEQEGAYEIRQVTRTPDLRNLKTLYVAYL